MANDAQKKLSKYLSLIRIPTQDYINQRPDRPVDHHDQLFKFRTQ